MLQDNNDAVRKYSDETAEEFNRIRALDLPQDQKDVLAQTYWNMRRWCHPNAFKLQGEN